MGQLGPQHACVVVTLAIDCLQKCTGFCALCWRQVPASSLIMVCCGMWQVIEFESNAMMIGLLGLRVSLIAYPVVSVKKASPSSTACDGAHHLYVKLHPGHLKGTWSF